MAGFRLPSDDEFLPEAGLTPELEWLLESGASDPAALAQALTLRVWPELVARAEVVLGDAPLGQAAALATLTRALREADRYRAAEGVGDWLARLAWAEVRRVGRERRRPVWLGGAGWLVAEVELARRWLETSESPPMAAAWEAAELAQIATEVARLAGQGRRRTGRGLRVMELGWLLVGGLLALGLLRWASQFDPLPTPTATPLARIVRRTVWVTRVPQVVPGEITATGTPARLGGGRLTEDSSAAELARRIQGGRSWRPVVWADVTLALAGPLGYLGPPEVYRVQVWNRGNVHLGLAGPAGAEPELGWWATDTLLLADLTQGGELRSDTFDEQPRLAWLGLRLQTLALLDVPFGGDPELRAAQNFVVVGYGEVAGVRTLRIEQRVAAGTRLAELWVEPTRGLTLQMRRWADAQTVAWAWQVNAYRFDQPPPDDWAAPHLTTWPQRFWDTAHEGLPPVEEYATTWLERPSLEGAAPTTLPTAATEVGVAAARLAFAYPPDFAAGRAPGYAEEVTVTVLADGTMVGKFPLPATPDLICSRAGTTLALTAGYWTEHQGGEWVYLLDLQEPSVPRRDFFVGGRVLRLALAPDAEVAALVLRGEQAQTQLVLLDTVSGAQRSLLPGAMATWVAWNRRGSLLGVWAAMPDTQQQELVVLLRATGEIVERRLLGNSLAIPADSQVASWGVRPLPNALPFYAYGLTDCVQP